MNDLDRSDQFGCDCTDAMLSITSVEISADRISKILSVEPTRTKQIGDVYKGIEISRNGWYLSSDGLVSSADTCDHIDWLFDQLKNKESQIADIKSKNCHIAIGCRWVSKHGRGGPVLREKQLLALASFGIPIGWDVWVDK